MQSTSIIRRWIRGSLLITVLVLVLAEGLFLYYSYNDLYGGVERAVENRFSTVVGRLQATGTAGDTATTAESRANVLRRVVEQFDEKDKFEFMLLDAQGVILATSSGTMNRDLTNGTDYGRALTSANGIGSAIFTTPQGERVMAVTMLVPYAAGSIAALRMVTSLTLIDGQWWRTVAICVGLGVLVDKDQSVKQAGGFIIQLMPFTPDEVVDRLEKKITEIDSVTQMLDRGLTPEQILEEILGDFGLEITDTTETRFHCDCSKERVSRALSTLSKKDLDSIIADGESIEVKCQFCNKAYEFTVDELKEMR